MQSSSNQQCNPASRLQREGLKSTCDQRAIEILWPPAITVHTAHLGASEYLLMEQYQLQGSPMQCSSNLQCSPVPAQSKGLERPEIKVANVTPNPEDPSGGGALEVPPRPWRGHIKLVDLLQIPFSLTLQDLENPLTAQRPCLRAPGAPHRAWLQAQ